LVNGEHAPTIDQLSHIFFSEGVPLAISAARKALHEAYISPEEVTHVVSTTCTNSANPGYDYYVCRALGISVHAEKILLHGVGCAGGLAALRTAANLACGASFRGRPAKVLVVALELCTLLVRSELDSVLETGECRVGVCLFSDCASALVLSNGIGVGDDLNTVYDLLGWEHTIIPHTEHDLGFDVHPLGWKVVLTPSVPSLTAFELPSAFERLLSLTRNVIPDELTKAEHFDWALHPGGATIMTGTEKAMQISPEALRASYDTYMNHGNSSSATVISVLDRLRSREMDGYALEDKTGRSTPKKYIVSAAFGPGVCVEMAMLKRNFSHIPREPLMGPFDKEVVQNSAGEFVLAEGPEQMATGELTPPETDSERSSEAPPIDFETRTYERAFAAAEILTEAGTDVGGLKAAAEGGPEIDGLEALLHVIELAGGTELD
jgi:type III polyketide synthase